MARAVEEGKPRLTKNATTARVCLGECDRDVFCWPAEKGASSWSLEPLNRYRPKKVTGWPIERFSTVMAFAKIQRPRSRASWQSYHALEQADE